MDKSIVVTESFRTMGTQISVDLVLSAGDSLIKTSGAFEAIKNIFAKNEKIFSRFREDSELSAINRSIGKIIKVSAEMLEVLQLCLKFNEFSTGYFDPRIIGNLEKIGYDKDFRKNDFNSNFAKEIQLEKFSTGLKQDLQIDLVSSTVLIKKRIDTTGIAKGYTVDEAAQYLLKAGFHNFIVDAGGDMRVFGLNDEHMPWRIAVEGIAEEKLMLRMTNEGMATSGIDRKRWVQGEKKYHHLINPKDPGNFSYDVKTVSVIENKTVKADGRAKVLVLMGREKGLQFANENKIKALFLDYKGNVYLSEAIKDYIF